MTPISSITLYKINVQALRKFSFGSWTSRQHVFVRISSGAHCGWGENIIAVNQPGIGLKEWGDALKPLIGLSPEAALAKVDAHAGLWKDNLMEIAEMALFDLMGKQLGKPALELLGLASGRSVEGVFVILSDDLAFVESQAQYAVAHGFSRYIKVKLFGKLELDEAILRTVRKQAPRERCFLIGDVNCGYRPDGNAPGLDAIAASLRRLYDAGLDACEDPARMLGAEWVTLQALCQPLPLIPDYPMRPSRSAIHSLLPGMGGYYNIHPGSAGSLRDAIRLAKRVSELGGKLMIGDDSLIGPACTVWQQLAIGLGASWVEAVEKPSDSDFYFQCIQRMATEPRRMPIEYKPAPGFGLELDEEKLRTHCAEVLTL